MRSFFVIALFLTALCSCSDYSNRPIYGEGTYSVGHGAYTINVKIIETSIVTYSVRHEGKEIIKSKERASLAQAWFIYFDQKKWLWVKSSDIGNYVWIPDKSGAYHEFDADQANIIKEVPRKIRKAFCDQ